MGKWLDIIPDEDLMDFAIDQYATYGWCEVKRVNLKDIGDAIKITWKERNFDEHSTYFNDFFRIEYDYKTEKFIPDFHNSVYNEKKHVKYQDFDDDDELIEWLDFMVENIERAGLNKKEYFKEFKQAYIKEFDLKNANNTRTKQIKKLFDTIDERYLEDEKENNDELSM